MWLTCDYHVILHHSSLLLLVRAVDALLCQNDALSRQSHDELHPVNPRKRSMCTRPFPCVCGGSGNETIKTVATASKLAICVTLCLTLLFFSSFAHQAARESTGIAHPCGIRRSVMVVTRKYKDPAYKPPPTFAQS